MIRIACILILLTSALPAMAVNPADLPPFSASDLEPAERAQISEFATGGPAARSKMFTHMQNVFPHAFEPNEWRVEWDKLHYRVSPADIVVLFGKPNAQFSLNEEPSQIVGVPGNADLSKHTVFLYKGLCAERHFKVVIQGTEHRSDGTFCDALRFEFDSGILIDQTAVELEPSMFPKGMKD